MEKERRRVNQDVKRPIVLDDLAITEGKDEGSRIERIHLMIERELPSSLKDIAASQISSPDVTKLLDRVMTSVKYLLNFIDQQAADGAKQRRVDLLKYPADLDKAMTASNLIYAVALNDGLLDDLDLLKMQDSVKKKIISGTLRSAAARLLRSPDMFGDETQLIFDGIIDRLKMRSPTKSH